MTTSLPSGLPFFQVSDAAELLAYSNDLANWNNQDPSPNLADTHYLAVVVVSCGPVGVGRLYEGSVVGITKTFLGRANQWLFISKGTAMSSQFSTVHKATFSWISAPEGGQAVLRWEPNPGFDPTIDEGKKGIQIADIRLIDGLLVGIGHEQPDNHAVKYIISFRKIKVDPAIVK